MNTIFHLSQYALLELKDTYSDNEIRRLCYTIFTDVLQYTNIDIHIKKNEILAESFVNKFYEIITQLKDNHPLQYIIGETEFAGNRFRLNSSTLIPRQETEELIQWANEYIKPGMKILDIGTGSGCIAISLAVENPHTEITGIDIAGNAITQARENAELNHTQVDFFLRDILHDEQYSWGSYDLIISNPPYVRQSEKTFMKPGVLNFEPHRALFVPDDDPLIFYRQIAGFGQKHLVPGGLLFFEINEALGSQTTELMEQMGYKNIILKKDINERDRFIKCSRKTESYGHQ